MSLIAVCKLRPWTTGTWQPEGEQYQYQISEVNIIHQQDAQRECQQCGAQLPSVINQAENDYLRGLLYTTFVYWGKYTSQMVL